MPSSSSEWEEAMFSSEMIDEIAQKGNAKEKLTQQILQAIGLYLNTKFVNFVDLDLCNESIQYNVVHKLKIRLFDKDQNHNAIILFKLLIFYNVPCRLLCNITTNQFLFFAVETPCEKINLKKKTNIVFSIDCQFKIQDLGLFYCNGKSRLLEDLINTTDDLRAEFYSELKSVAGNTLSKDENASLPDNKYFVENDEKILRKLPTSLNMFKKHPYYVLESLLKVNQAIHPKRPVHGYYKGEPVYPRANIQNLRTEKQLYRQGKKVIDKAYRIIDKNGKKIKLYAKWQVVDIQKTGLDQTSRMDYFHENHIPIDCVYIDDIHAVTVARSLKIEYREVCVAIRREPIIKGIFVYKKDELLLCNALAEYTAKVKVNQELEKKEEALFLWGRLIKKVCRYKKIKDRLQ